tara:strand:- start:1576 stop:1896 length:321 start_codon:yes stop_codon:yes gene_type:complete
MIPFLRSITELMLITKSRGQCDINSRSDEYYLLTEDSGQRKRYIRSKEQNIIKLPNMTRTPRRNWQKSKEAVSRFLDTLDYNNQIQSSYDLTLLDRQNDYDYHDVA